ncbi:MAG: 30S ribosome-binding factor RbfA [Acidimicrobiales bacterium]
MARRRRSGTTRREYPRTARVNELVREIVADELERIDDDRLELLAVTAVDIEADLRHATIYFDTLQGEDGDDEVLEALGEHRVRLQAAIGRQARLRRTPELGFRPDPAVRSGERIEAILRDIPPAGDADPAEADDADAGVGADVDADDC